MWGRSRIKLVRNDVAKVGTPLTVTKSVADVKRKQSNRLGAIVSVSEVITASSNEHTALVALNDIVYYKEKQGKSAPPHPEHLAAPLVFQHTLRFTPVQLFRFSALTFNSHRIHWDCSFARGLGFGGLVVHGPLLGLCAMNAMSHCFEKRGQSMKAFEYTLSSPLCINSATDNARAKLEIGAKDPLDPVMKGIIYSDTAVILRCSGTSQL